MEESQSTKKFNPMIIVGGVVLLAVIGLGIAFATSNNSNTSPTPTPEMDMGTESNQSDIQTQSSPAVEGEQSDSMSDSDVQVVNIEAGSFYYKPNEIRVKKGQTVKVTLQSVDMMHNFVIDELNVDMPVVQNGNTGTVEFTADQAGEFEFYCSVGQHKQLGQVGTLIVEE